MAGGDDLLDPDAVAGLNRGHCFGPVGRNAGEFLEKVSLFDSGSNCSIASLAEKIRIARPVVRSVAGQDLEVKSFRESRSTLEVSVNGPFTISDCVDE